MLVSFDGSQIIHRAHVNLGMAVALDTGLIVPVIRDADKLSLDTIKFGPLYLKAPDGLENFLRYNYPTLHRYTEEEQDKINNHYPAVLSFNIPNDHIATS